MALGGYVIGKRIGKQRQYAMLSVPLSVVTYFAVVVASGSI